MTYDEVAQQYQVDPALVDAVTSAESSGNPNAVSPKGATGLMQLMPPTAQEMAGKLGMDGDLDLKDPELNKTLGTAYLGEMIQRYENPQLALAAYNAGPGRLDEAIEKAQSRDPEAVMQFLPQETRDYVPKVMNRYAQIAPVSGPLPPAAQPTEQDLLGAGQVAQQDLQEQEDAFELQKQAVVEASAAGIAQATEEAAYTKTAAEEAQRLALEQQAQEVERQQRLDAQEQRVEQALADYSSKKVDPRGYWKDKSTGDKIVASIAIVLSSIGQSMQAQGGVQAPNMALEAINRAVDKDIEAQKAEIDSKGNVLNAQRGILSDMRSRFGDEREAELAARTVGLNLAQLKLQELAAQYKAPEIAAKAKGLYGQLEQQKEKHKAELLKLENTSPARQLTIRQKVIAGELPPSILSKDDRERYVEGLGFAPTAEEAKKVRTAKSDWQELDGVLGEIIETREEYGAEFANRSVVRQQKGRAALALLKIKNLEQLGALDRGAIEIGARMIPEDPTEIGFVTGQVEAIREQFRNNYRSKIESRLIERLPAGKSITTFKQAGE